MAHDIEIREKVRKLRSQGLTYSEILSRLKIKLPKSTLSDWCSDILMPKWYQAKVDELNERNLDVAQKRAELYWHSKQRKLLMNLSNKNNNLSKKLGDKEVARMLLAMLYLGEGSKRPSHSGLSLGSSDPNIICLYIKLLKFCYDIEPHLLKCRVSYRADQNIRDLEKYWSGITGISSENFYKTIPDPRTVGKPTKNLDYKGVCVIITGHSEIQLELELISKIILKGL